MDATIAGIAPGRTIPPDIAEEDLAAWVDSIKQAPQRRDELAALLPERHPVYTNRSTNAAIRIRGYILAAFAEMGLPNAARPHVLDELENGYDAYLVAAAAQALRGLPEPTAEVVPFLLKAVQNIKFDDDAVTFAQYKPQWPVDKATTALKEIFRTFQWLGSAATAALPELEHMRDNQVDFSPTTRAEIQKAIAAIRHHPTRSAGFQPASRQDADATSAKATQGVGGDCCSPPAGRQDAGATLVEAPHMHVEEGHCCSPPAGTEETKPAAGDPASNVIPLLAIENGPPMPAATGRSIGHILLEDHDGRPVRFGDFFRGQPAIVVFFYTRCNNPNKCSLTITKLGRLQKRIAGAGLSGKLKTAAITYDPEYDLPSRLKGYGENREILFSANNRILRTRTGFPELQEFFQLGVNFNNTIVNRHRIELFILDDQGTIAYTFARRQWDLDEVFTKAKSLTR